MPWKRTCCSLFIATLCLSATQAFAAPPPSRVFGTVARVAGNGRSFDIVDRNGNPITIPISGTTQYGFNSNPDSTAAEVLTPGEPVQVTLGDDGTATEVENRSRGHRTALELRPSLDLNDAEWSVIKPLLAKLVDDERALNGQENGDIRNLDNQLRYLVRTGANESDLASTMSQLHQARERAQSELKQVRQQLISLLTLRQEASLVEAGVLD